MLIEHFAYHVFAKNMLLQEKQEIDLFFSNLDRNKGLTVYKMMLEYNIYQQKNYASFRELISYIFNSFDEKTGAFVPKIIVRHTRHIVMMSKKESSLCQIS
ncbi:MAG: hypothetical protein AB8U25_04455 [Rickettsiales endosymbiont of Dermacentor nuttalli]